MLDKSDVDTLAHANMNCGFRYIFIIIVIFDIYVNTILINIDSMQSMDKQQKVVFKYKHGRLIHCVTKVTVQLYRPTFGGFLG